MGLRSLPARVRRVSLSAPTLWLLNLERRGRASEAAAHLARLPQLSVKSRVELHKGLWLVWRIICHTECFKVDP